MHVRIIILLVLDRHQLEKIELNIMTLLYIYRRKLIFLLIIIFGLLIILANSFITMIRRPVRESLSIDSIKEILHFPSYGEDKISTEKPNQLSQVILTNMNQETRNNSVYNMSALAKNDSTTLIDLKNFKFILNCSPCKSSPDNPYLLIFIHTAADHVERRDVLRTTWAKKSNKVRLIFLFGEVDSIEIQNEIVSEKNKYDDIVQGNFHDSYHNLTYKHVMGLKWTTYYCQSATYILKTDDDSFVNTPFLLNYLPTAISTIDTKNKILCTLMDGSPIIRDKNSKWYVSESEFPGDCYPVYCSGYMILYSPDIVFKLYKESPNNKYFWVDDAYVTGVLAAKVNVTRHDTSKYLVNYDNMFSMIKNNTPYKPFLYAFPNLQVDIMKRLWKLIENVNETVH